MSLTVPRIRASASTEVLKRATSTSLAEWLPVGLLAVLAFVLRLSQIHQSLVSDEYWTYQDVVGHSLATVISTVHTGGENSPPLFFVLAWATAKLGDPSVWIRLPSGVFGSATVPVVYMIGRSTVGRVAGMIGAAVLTVAPFAVFYGIEARPYATMAFFVALSTLAVLRATSTRSRRWWALYVVSAAAAAYSHYTCVFVLAAQGAWSWWACRDRLRQPMIANALVALLYVPWLPELRGKALAVIGGLYPLGVGRVLSDLLRPIPGHPGSSLRVIPTVGGLIVVGVCVLAGLVALGIRAHRSAPGRLASRLPGHFGLLVLLTVASPVGLLLYSLLATDIWLPRGLSASLPAAALVLGTLLAALPRPMTAVSVLAVIATLVAGSLRSFEPAHARGPYRTIASYLDRVAGPRDPVVLASFNAAFAVPVETHRRHLFVPIQALRRPLPPGQRVYAIIDDATTHRASIRALQTANLQLIAERRYQSGNDLPGFTRLLTYRAR